jgi:DNA-binding CsgD family transcriptional regulator
MFYAGTLPLDMAEYHNVIVWAALVTNVIQIPFFLFFVMFKKMPKLLLFIISVLCTALFFVYYFLSSETPGLNMLFLYLSSIVFGFFRPMAVIGWFDFIYSLDYREVQRCSAAAVCFAASLVLLMMSIDQLFSKVVISLLPLLSAAVYVYGGGRAQQNPRLTPALEKPKEVFAVIRKVPKSFLLVILVVATANGYIRGINIFGEPHGSILVFSAICLCCALLPFIKTMKSIYYISILSIAVGTNIMFISASSISYSLIGFGQIGTSIIAWVACVSLAKKFRVRSGIIGGFVWSVLTLGQALGNGLGMLGNAQPFAEFSFGVFVPLLIESLILLVLVFTLNKPFLSLVHIEEQNIEKESDYAGKISSIKSRFHLTPREAEVFEMLAYGRNARHIESKLCISSNTVKTHIRNIYIKTGANNHQELLSIIESED